MQAPGDPQTLNRYAYGFNSPLKYIDPSGHVSIPFDQFWQLLVAAGAGFAAAVASPVVVTVGVAGGGVAGLTVACLEYCNGSWDEPRYASFPLPAESGSEIMTTPLAGGQTTTMLSLPLGGPAMPTIETYPATGPSQPLVLTHPSNPSNVPTAGGVITANNDPITKRPSHWRAGTRQAAQQTAPVNESGERICMGCGNTMTKGDIDHHPSVRQRILQKVFKTRQEFLNDYNDPERVRLLCPTCNRSRRFENTPTENLPYYPGNRR